jgi:hypothetical protein
METKPYDDDDKQKGPGKNLKTPICWNSGTGSMKNAQNVKKGTREKRIAKRIVLW